jgi:antitoxin component YwqK of YwqJK toxin-antitoxin module
VKHELVFKKGKLEGTCREYYKDGTLKAERSYENGLLEGPALRYHPNGTVQADALYSKGIPQHEKYFDEQGKPIKQQ